MHSRIVALLAEGVDRNLCTLILPVTASTVALLAEGVDRNRAVLEELARVEQSLSSRRAWIEMRWAIPTRCPTTSLSSRRAWIEILLARLSDAQQNVALLAEGVDRNLTAEGGLKNDDVALLAEGVDRNR